VNAAVPLRIANCSGFWGDRMSAAREMVDGGPIDVLTGDYLAELTMAILARRRLRHPDGGYVPTFLTQMEGVLGTCLDRGIKVVTNAGGLDPHRLGQALDALADRLGLSVTVATVTGDDVEERYRKGEVTLDHMVDGRSMASAGLEPLTANAYLGAWGIAAALGAGADVVVTGRVADASLVTGPCAWRFGWERDDWDRLAGSVVAGHIIECGAQATGGNYSFFAEIPGLDDPGFPIAEVYPDGSSVITKHPGTGGVVSVGTVTAQLLYEVAGPRYPSPDVVARLDSVRLIDLGGDRVRVEGVQGEPPPTTAKVAATALAGYRNQVRFVLTGLDVEAKADAALAGLWRRVGGAERFAAVDVRLVRTDSSEPQSNEAAMAYLQVTVDDPDPAVAGRAFSSAAVESALAGYPGFLLTSPPGEASPLVVFWPATCEPPATVVEVAGTRFEVAPTQGEDPPTEPGAAHQPEEPIPEDEPTVDLAIGRLVGARSGDKGGDANLGVWAKDESVYAWLERFLTVDRLRELVPDVEMLTVERHRFPALLALNFVVREFLGDGAASSLKWDPQAKTFGEYFRSRHVPAPERLVAF
jgi:hypothetical protein